MQNLQIQRAHCIQKNFRLNSDFKRENILSVISILSVKRTLEVFLPFMIFSTYFNVFISFIYQPFIDFITDAQDVMFNAEISNYLEFLFCVDLEQKKYRSVQSGPTLLLHLAERFMDSHLS